MPMRKVAQSRENAEQSIHIFGELLEIQEDAVPKEVRCQALFRRIIVCFVGVSEYLRTKGDIRKNEINNKPIYEIVDLMIQRKVLAEQDRMWMCKAGNIFANIGFYRPGIVPDEDKIMKEAENIYAFLKRVMDTESDA